MLDFEHDVNDDLNEDIEEEIIEVESPEEIKAKISLRRKNDLKKKQNELNRVKNNKYGQYSGYVDWDYIDGVWQPVGNYVKRPNNSRYRKYLKKQTSRRIRSSKFDDEAKALKGNHYRKKLDFWWELF